MSSWQKKLGYIGKVVPSDIASKTRLKRCIQTSSIMDAKSKEERKKIFGNLDL